jgi:putative holliday junction resolvase
VAIIAIDLGARRIGIATSDSGSIASPHSVMKNEGDIIQKISRLGEELGADEFVVGLPRRAHHSAAEQKFHDFAETLRQRSCKPVSLWDETLSTVEAAEMLRADGHSRRESKDRVDMVAAAVILQSFLDDRNGRTS